MRKFALLNEYGQRIEFQGGDVFLYAPEGLGFEDDIEYMQSDGFFFPTSDDEMQVDKTGTLVFFGDGYQHYKDVMDWALSATSLQLEYKPKNTAYYQNVKLSTVEKSELKLNSKVLEVPVVFKPLSPIYNPDTIVEDFETDDVGDGKIYTYTYPYRYSISGLLGTITYTAMAQMPCDIGIDLSGTISAPSITVTRNDTGEIIGEIDLTAISLQNGESISYNTIAGKAGVIITEADGKKTDATQFLGLGGGYPTFFKVPANVPCTYQIRATTLSGLSARLRIYRYYRTV